MINAIQHLRMFDVVTNHAYQMSRPTYEKWCLPCSDWERFEKAKEYALYLNRLGLLETFYRRILERKV